MPRTNLKAKPTLLTLPDNARFFIGRPESDEADAVRADVVKALVKGEPGISVWRTATINNGVYTRQPGESEIYILLVRSNRKTPVIVPFSDTGQTGIDFGPTANIRVNITVSENGNDFTLRTPSGTSIDTVRFR